MVAKRKKANGHSDAAVAKVAFDYVKSQYFRVVRADGAIGNVTPNGMIHFALYSERPAIPRRLVFSIDPAGTLGPMIEAETVTRGSIVREMDVDVFLRPEVAESLHKWLGERIQDAKGLSKSRASGGKK